MHTDGGAVIRQPGRAWLEGTPAIDHEMKGKRIHVYSNKRDIKQNTHQKTRSMDEEHICEIFFLSFFLWFEDPT